MLKNGFKDEASVFLIVVDNGSTDLEPESSGDGKLMKLL